MYISKFQLFPITIQLTQPFEYKLNSLINRIVSKDKQFFDLEKTEKIADEYLDSIVLPTLNFLAANEIKTNIVITGKLLKYIENNKKVKLKCKYMLDRGLVNFIADAYYGESLVSLSHTSIWLDSVTRTVKLIKEVLGANTQCIFVAQLFRSLELEKVTEHLGITNFLTRKKGQKPDMFELKLSEFRRFDGEDVSWITIDKDVKCEFYNVSDNLFYELNLLLFEKNIQQALTAENMKMGLNHAQYILKSNQKNRDMQAKTIRIEEKYSLYLYNHLQRAVIRLWEHGNLVLSSNRIVDNKLHEDLMHALAKLQSSFYLHYLEKKYFTGQTHHAPNFTSQYEACVNMQSAIKEIEILIRNKI